LIQFRSGVRSRISLPLLGKFSQEIAVSPVQLTYLWPADGTSNLYLADPISGDNQELTQDPYGVLDYAISQNGEKIIYSAAAEKGASRIMILDRDSGELSEIMVCSDGLCTAPRISPDGNLVAYEYIPREPGRQPTVQVLDIKTLAQIDLGEKNHYLENPTWSPSGWLSYYNQSQKSYQFWNPISAEEISLPNETGGDGSWSPDGRYFICSEILFLSDTLAPRHLQLFDLIENTLLDLSRGSYPEDLNPSFAPSGLTVAYSHKSLDPASWTPGRELWILNINSGENTQLTEVVDYQHTSFAWHPDGEQLAFVRYNQTALSDPPEIWLINTTGGDPLRLIINGFQPGWIP
jgi:Tol biopolymer transport system component